MTHKWWCASLPSWNRAGSIPVICSKTSALLRKGRTVVRRRSSERLGFRKRCEPRESNVTKVPDHRLFQPHPERIARDDTGSSPVSATKVEAAVVQLVEHVLGKDEVAGSIPAGSSDKCRCGFSGDSACLVSRNTNTGGSSPSIGSNKTKSVCMDLIEKIESLLQRIEAGENDPLLLEELARAQAELRKIYKDIKADPHDRSGY